MTREIERVGQGFKLFMQFSQQGVLLMVYVVLAILDNSEFAILVVSVVVLSSLALKSPKSYPQHSPKLIMVFKD
jgi:hypothetical protein